MPALGVLKRERPPQTPADPRRPPSPPSVPSAATVCLAPELPSLRLRAWLLPRSAPGNSSDGDSGRAGGEPERASAARMAARGLAEDQGARSVQTSPPAVPSRTRFRVFPGPNTGVPRPNGQWNAYVDRPLVWNITLQIYDGTFLVGECLVFWCIIARL